MYVCVALGCTAGSHRCARSSFREVMGITPSLECSVGWKPRFTGGLRASELRVFRGKKGTSDWLEGSSSSSGYSLTSFL